MYVVSELRFRSVCPFEARDAHLTDNPMIEKMYYTEVALFWHLNLIFLDKNLCRVSSG